MHEPVRYLAVTRWAARAPRHTPSYQLTSQGAKHTQDAQQLEEIDSVSGAAPEDDHHNLLVRGGAAVLFPRVIGRDTQDVQREAEQARTAQHDQRPHYQAREPKGIGQQQHARAHRCIGQVGDRAEEARPASAPGAFHGPDVGGARHKRGIDAHRWRHIWHRQHANFNNAPPTPERPASAVW
jgi:hypothetical protein